jgi:hypothetical protein
MMIRCRIIIVGLIVVSPLRAGLEFGRKLYPKLETNRTRSVLLSVVVAAAGLVFRCAWPAG